MWCSFLGSGLGDMAVIRGIFEPVCLECQTLRCLRSLAVACVVVGSLTRGCVVFYFYYTTVESDSISILIAARHGTGSLGHRVNGSFGSSFTSGSPGHRVIILTGCETRVFPVFEKTPKIKI